MTELPPPSLPGTGLSSLVDSGTKLWLDSIDPDLVLQAKKDGATGATSNPIIIANLLKSGRFDETLQRLMGEGLDDDQVAWAMTDQLVKDAQRVFLNSWERSSGNDGYVSFELDPLIEDPTRDMPLSKRVAAYVELGKKWSADHKNRMIKVPATPAGLASLEDLAAAGIPLNVTLIFSERQYKAAREAVWRGAQKCESLAYFKSVYSIFVSRVDVYSEQHCPGLSDGAQGQVGIVNSKQIWAENQKFWSDKDCPLDQEIVFASTGTKKADDPPWKYVEALAGSDIQTNPPATNQKVAESGRTISRHIDELPEQEVLDEIAEKVDAKKTRRSADAGRDRQVRETPAGTVGADRENANGAGGMNRFALNGPGGQCLHRIRAGVEKSLFSGQTAPQSPVDSIGNLFLRIFSAPRDYTWFVDLPFTKYSVVLLRPIKIFSMTEEEINPVANPPSTEGLYRLGAGHTPRRESLPHCSAKMSANKVSHAEDAREVDDDSPEVHDEMPSPRERIGLYCFSCNRPEGHYLANRGRWYFSYLLGLTFGLIKVIGPYQCQCCGAKRLMRSDHSNLRYRMRSKGPASRTWSPRRGKRK